MMLRLNLKVLFVFSFITLSASFTGFDAGAAENTVNVSTAVDPSTAPSPARQGGDKASLEGQSRAVRQAHGASNGAEQSRSTNSSLHGSAGSPYPEPVEGQAEVRRGVDKPIVGIGDKIKYIISVSLPKDADVEFPEFGQTLGKLNIKDSGSSRKDSFRKKILTRWYLLETYVPGEYTIPSTTVRYKSGKDADWKTLEISSLKVEVKSVLKDFPEALDIRDIKGPVAFPGKIIFYILRVLAVLILLSAFIAGVVSAIKRRGEKAKPVKLKLPHEVAYKRFEELKAKGLVPSGKIKEFYIELSDIVRRYLEDRFGLKAPEMTTEEFLQKVKTTEKLEAAQKNLLREFLSHCDLVKFAKYGPEQEEIESSFESAVRLVDQTKKKEEALSQING